MPASRVLVVDDDSQIRDLLRIILERAGYGVDLASDGAEALRIFAPERHALVITDIVMPEKEGIEMIMDLRRTAPELPFIAISGGGRIDAEEYLAWVQRIGVVHTFTKPLRRQDLLEAVTGLIGEPVA